MRWEAILQIVSDHPDFDGIDNVGDADVDVGDVDMKREQLLEKCNLEI